MWGNPSSTSSSTSSSSCYRCRDKLNPRDMVGAWVQYSLSVNTCMGAVKVQCSAVSRWACPMPGSNKTCSCIYTHMCVCVCVCAYLCHNRCSWGVDDTSCPLSLYLPHSLSSRGALKLQQILLLPQPASGVSERAVLARDRLKVVTLQPSGGASLACNFFPCYQAGAVRWWFGIGR